MRSLTSAPGSTAPGKEIAASGAPATVRAHQGWLRRSARHTLGFRPGDKRKAPRTRGRDDGVPGATKNTGDDAWLFEI